MPRLERGGAFLWALKQCGWFLNAHHRHGRVARVADQQVLAIGSTGETIRLIKTVNSTNECFAVHINDSDSVAGKFRDIRQWSRWVKGNTSWITEASEGFDEGKAIVFGVVNVKSVQG